jgi:hypothetical protein
VTGYRTSFEVDATPAAVRDAICDPRAWWGSVVGETNRPGAEFVFEVPGVHWSRLRVVESTVGRVVWEVLEARIEYVEEKDEWTGTRIVFTIEPITVGSRVGSRVGFEHEGLMPALECYDSCSQAWATLIHDSLRGLLREGVGNPYRSAAAS